MDILLEEGIPAPARRRPKKLRGLDIRAAIKGLKKGQSILVTGTTPATVRVAAAKMRAAGEIKFRTVSRTVKDGHSASIRMWRVG